MASESSSVPVLPFEAILSFLREVRFRNVTSTDVQLLELLSEAIRHPFSGVDSHLLPQILAETQQILADRELCPSHSSPYADAPASPTSSEYSDSDDGDDDGDFLVSSSSVNPVVHEVFLDPPSSPSVVGDEMDVEDVVYDELLMDLNPFGPFEVPDPEIPAHDLYVGPFIDDFSLSRRD